MELAEPKPGIGMNLTYLMILLKLTKNSNQILEEKKAVHIPNKRL